MKIRHILFGSMSLVIALLLTVGLVEFVVRTAFKESMEFSIEMWKYARWMKRIAPDPRIAHEHVPNVSARLMGVEVTINSNKLRDREIPFQKPPDTTRIVMLGDSLTLGWGVEFEHTTSKVLERELNAMRAPQRVEVINAGVGNYNTSMEVEYFLNEGFLFSPDVIILNYFINDAEDTPRYTGHFLNENLQSWVYFAGRLDTLRRTFGNLRTWHEHYSGLYREEAPGWLQTQAAVKKLGAWCDEHQIQCLFVNQPELHDLKDYPFADVNRKLALLASEAGLEYLDLLPAVREQSEDTLWVTAADPHPNEKACTLFGKALAAHLADKL